MSLAAADLARELKRRATEEGFDAVGIAAATSAGAADRNPGYLKMALVNMRCLGSHGTDPNANQAPSERTSIATCTLLTAWPLRERSSLAFRSYPSAASSLSTTFSGTSRIDADVVTIASKCLEKETARRYQSAAALGEDVQRYLTDQPILARPPSAVYQFRKLLLRHKGPFGAAAAIFVLLIAFSIGMTMQAIRIGRERDRANVERDRANLEAETARQVSEFLEGLFKVSDEWAAHDMPTWRKEISPRELLDKGAVRIEREISDPKIQARLLRTIGNAYGGLGLQDKSEPILKRWADLTERLYGQESLEYADVLNWRGGIDNLRRAHAIRSRLLAPSDRRLARSLYWIALEESNAGDPAGDLTFAQALNMAKATTPPDEQHVCWVLQDRT